MQNRTKENKRKDEEHTHEKRKIMRKIVTAMRKYGGMVISSGQVTG